MAIRRKIIKIDEEKCNGCGLCVPACAEGAIQIIGGKARLVSETYCDGLGACLGECPTGAITIEEREAEQFNQAAVEAHLARQAQEKKAGPALTGHGFQGCPGSLSRMLPVEEPTHEEPDDFESTPSRSKLGNWPVQLKLAPLSAPYFQAAKLLISADCVPFAHADFHREFLAGKIVLIGCPKLDDPAFYRRKLAEIFMRNRISSIDVLIMEVPCCFGLANLVEEALNESGKEIPITYTTVGISGEVLDKRTSPVF
jgi:Fe-S-cluster-containing hydrogenase component 2